MKINEHGPKANYMGSLTNNVKGERVCLSRESESAGHDNDRAQMNLVHQKGFYLWLV